MFQSSLWGWGGGSSEETSLQSPLLDESSDETPTSTRSADTPGKTGCVVANEEATAAVAGSTPCAQPYDDGSKRRTDAGTTRSVPPVEAAPLPTALTNTVEPPSTTNRTYAASAGTDTSEACSSYVPSSSESVSIPQSPSERLHRRRPHTETTSSDLSRRRILDRDAAYHQSRGRWRIQNHSRDAARHRILPTGIRQRLTLRKQFLDDWFYSLAYKRTIVLMFILFFTYTLIVFGFAFLYLGVSVLGRQVHVNPDGSTSKSPFCDMDIHDHMEALYFSLSTMTTIGYGVSDYYFGGCWTPLILVLSQVCCAITFDAIAIGLLFQRISRGHKRGKTVVFSDKAVVQRVRGDLYLMFRIAELRHHQLRDASVRAYCIRHERHRIQSESNPGDTRNSSPHDGMEEHPATLDIETTYFVTRAMPLQHEHVGPQVLMSLPQVLVHKIDASSPLSQPESWYDGSGFLHQRSTVDAMASGEVASLEEQSGTEAFLQDREVEIVILVEGTDELTGASIQARHSYVLTDLAWNHRFAPCVFPADHVNRGDSVVSSHGEEPSQYSRSCCCLLSRVCCLCGAGRSCRQRRRFRRRQRLWSSPRQNPQLLLSGSSSSDVVAGPVCIVDFAAFHDIRPAPANAESSPHLTIPC